LRRNPLSPSASFGLSCLSQHKNIEPLAFSIACFLLAHSANMRSSVSYMKSKTALPILVEAKTEELFSFTPESAACFCSHADNRHQQTGPSSKTPVCNCNLSETETELSDYARRQRRPVLKSGNENTRCNRPPPPSRTRSTMCHSKIIFVLHDRCGVFVIPRCCPKRNIRSSRV